MNKICYKIVNLWIKDKSPGPKLSSLRRFHCSSKLFPKTCSFTNSQCPQFNVNLWRRFITGKLIFIEFCKLEDLLRSTYLGWKLAHSTGGFKTAASSVGLLSQQGEEKMRSVLQDQLAAHNHFFCRVKKLKTAVFLKMTTLLYETSQHNSPLLSETCFSIFSIRMCVRTMMTYLQCLYSWIIHKLMRASLFSTFTEWYLTPLY